MSEDIIGDEVGREALETAIILMNAAISHDGSSELSTSELPARHHVAMIVFEISVRDTSYLPRQS